MRLHSQVLTDHVNSGAKPDNFKSGHYSMAGYDEGEYVTADEACDILGVTRRTLDRYVDAGRIRKYRRGIRNVVFRRVDVERLKRELEEVRPIDEEE